VARQNSFLHITAFNAYNAAKLLHGRGLNAASDCFPNVSQQVAFVELPAAYR
jgi:hypothetical protein